jgi:hypothetical protein
MPEVRLSGKGGNGIQRTRSGGWKRSTRSASVTTPKAPSATRRKPLKSARARRLSTSLTSSSGATVSTSHVMMSRACMAGGTTPPRVGV